MEATVSKAEHDALKAKYNALEYRFEQLLKLIKGFKSERFQPAAPHPDQDELFESGILLAEQEPTEHIEV